MSKAGKRLIKAAKEAVAMVRTKCEYCIVYDNVLSDPIKVHINMLHGVIAKPSIENIIHIYGRDALLKGMEAEDALACVAQVRRDALEEAARECEAQIIQSSYPRTLGDAAAAIRSLIDKQKGRRHPEG